MTEHIPERRHFLLLGGAAVGAVALAACSDDPKPPPSETGVTQPRPADATLAPPMTTDPAAGQANDVVVTRTAVSLERAAAWFYAVALDEGEVARPAPITFDPAVEEALRTLRSRHQAHATTFSDLARGIGGETVTQPNQALVDEVIVPVLPTLGSQAALLGFARTLENLVTSTYGWAAGVLTTPALRQAVMGVGGATARYAAAVSLLADPSGATAAPRPVLDVSGPARVPNEMFVQDGQDGGDVSTVPVEADAEPDTTEGGASGG